MIEYDHEPVRGLPGDLPKGEAVLWQGAPDWRVFLRTALYSRWITGYFALLALWSVLSGSVGGALASVIAAIVTLGLLAGFAVLVARTSVYTITNRRIVLRIGVALNKCINLPLHLIGSAELRGHANGFGDIALHLSGRHGLGYAMLWPHARPWKLSAVQPMLRALPNADAVAKLLADACNALVPNVKEEPRTSTVNRPATGLEEAHA
ncbi:photosynthetic complex putative assembly protein PuhB [Aurantiacibacter sediminis]|uniref:PH domain-containing protein n=1 Tax=Aurantiacibacter sediminis TaxID=2793064 RepID=A0ABS0N1X5_9SPHN|nr:photosynthetic complex putative assembly protein PuhB [Aurantiacibacter sediminis]MBH5321965.1 PH domain-containing protein [Aurantiacibacter sediminis]